MRSTATAPPRSSYATVRTKTEVAGTTTADASTISSMRWRAPARLSSSSTTRWNPPPICRTAAWRSSTPRPARSCAAMRTCSTTATVARNARRHCRPSPPTPSRRCPHVPPKRTRSNPMKLNANEGHHFTQKNDAGAPPSTTCVLSAQADERETHSRLCGVTLVPDWENRL